MQVKKHQWPPAEADKRVHKQKEIFQALRIHWKLLFVGIANVCVCVCVCVGMFMWFMRTQICIMTWVWHRYYKEKVIYEDIFSVPII